MKLKKVASLCGKTKMFCLYDRAERDDVVSQWLGDGYAIYPITGLPYMDEENIYSMFDISAKQQEKIIFRPNSKRKSYSATGQRRRESTLTTWTRQNAAFRTTAFP